MRFDIKEDGREILMVCVASLIMALNIKTLYGQAACILVEQRD